MKKKLTILLILFLITSETITLSLIFKKEDKTILEDIELINKFNNKRQMISIQVENDNDYEYHEYEDRSKWPDRNIYTFAGSLCTDWGGNTIADNIIKFDETTHKVTITTKRTAYCTLYFTKGKPALTVLKNKGGSKFNSTSAVFGLYRFNGTKTDVTDHNLNNYICFGTTDIATCTGSDKQYYMYRIIGITDGTTTNTTLGLEANQLKIIRAYPSNQSIQWHNSLNVNAKWDGTNPVADIQIYLNGSFLTTDKTKWKNDYWEGIIDEPYWYIGDNTDQNATTETTEKSCDVHKIGLMYKSDFVNSGPAGNPNGQTNWLYVYNGIRAEWTMTRYGINGPLFNAWRRHEDGGLYQTDTLIRFNAVRPVFYLKSNVTLAGEGTETSPFIITSKN